MPTVPTYPGVYIEEVPSSVRTIVGVATSITAFVGRTLRGAVDEPARVQSFADFERRFGGLWSKSSVSYAVQHYFLNGGVDALIVRVHNGAQPATITLPGEGGGAQTVLEADNPGEWGNSLRAAVDYLTSDPADTRRFNLFLREIAPDGSIIQIETFRNISVDPASPRFIQTVLAQESRLVNVRTLSAARPAETPLVNNERTFLAAAAGSGTDGAPISAAQVTAPGLEAPRRGIFALEKSDLFNLLCIPPYDRESEAQAAEPSKSDYDAALAYCKKRRAMLVVDPPRTWLDIDAAESDALASAFSQDPNAVIYFPRVRMADPLLENRLGDFVPCGVMSGVMARIDGQRGVWKASAGTEATLIGVRELAYKMTDGENGRLNPLGVNCLRTFPIIGNVAWGARTTRGADQFASEWKYAPVRRLALFIEESLYRGTQWAVFEPNDEPLWSQLRLNVGGFMQDLFRKGAFQGSSPRQAYLVKCDSETTTQLDIDRGIVNIIVGFAPLKPAEFVIIKISQLAGQEQA
jgi:phage tail sheath protein FI